MRTTWLSRVGTSIAAGLCAMAVSGGLCGVAQAGPRDCAVYVTRLGGDPEAAQPYINKFLETLEAAMGWPKGSTKGRFFTTRKETLAYLDSDKPGLAIIEPSLYFEVRKTRGAEPLVVVESPDLVSGRLHVVVKDPAIKGGGLADLKGKRVWTQLADAPKYLSKMVLVGQDVGKELQLKQIGQAMKGVRAVLRGEADATLLDDEQLAAARKLEGGEALRAIFDSPPLPPLPFVQFNQALSPDDKRKLVKVLLELCGTPKGGEVCKEMHISKFAPVPAAAMVEAQKRYDQP